MAETQGVQDTQPSAGQSGLPGMSFPVPLLREGFSGTWGRQEGAV